MVCNRCIKVVREEFEKLGLVIKNIQLGEVELLKDETKLDMQKIDNILKSNGFELLDNKNAKIIEKVKILIIDMIRKVDSGKDIDINFSEYLANEAGLNYNYLSTLFSSLEGITIEKYIIHQKIEKVKELIVYGELTLSEIAFRLGYSSVQHLSNQFKKITGLTPSYFKSLKSKSRKTLDNIY
ncbi:MAG TPA: AraC family transcriptional regulator [Ignavibacteriales bacterium]|nr:AraC family transcriptional regulator [Ignavibacteriales bacterium]